LTASRPEELSRPAITLTFLHRWSNGTGKAGSDCGCFTSSGLISIVSLLGALWADSRLGARYLPVLDGCAMVTDIDWIRDPGRSVANWMPCPVRVYDNAHRDDAARWLALLATAGQPTIAQTATAYVGGTVGASASIAKLLLIKPFRR
jgi:hypothetical protein